jgi:hypothetical protein
MKKGPLKTKPSLDSLIASFRVEGIIISKEKAKRIAQKVDEEFKKRKQS